MKLNKGEWSELYAMLHLLIHKKLQLVDCKLNKITDEIFEINQIKRNSRENTIIFKFNDNDDILPIVSGKTLKIISADEIREFKEKLFDKIKIGKGAFSIDIAKQWLDDKDMPPTFKSPAGTKSDITLDNYDYRQNRLISDIGYSIKS